MEVLTALEQVAPEQAPSEQAPPLTTDEAMNQAFGMSSKEEEDEEDGGQQQQLVNYMFSLIFKFHFIFNYFIMFCIK